jgi:DNA-binding CsgD family transcriptional regulator
METWFKKAYPDKSYREKVITVWKKITADSNPAKEFKPHQFTVRCKGGQDKIIRFTHVALKDRKQFITYEDITEKATAEEALMNREKELEIKTTNLEEVNTALRVLLKRREEDKMEIEEKVLFNMKDLVIPYIKKLETTGLSSRQKSYLSILKSNLTDIISPFSRRLAASHLILTPKEVQVANLIKEDRITKEISELLFVSESSVKFHRHNIRKKLGMVHKKINLRTYLQSLER